MVEVNDLLIKIQQAVGCPYLSDLHADCRPFNKQTKELILSVPLEQYSLQEWNMAASYITGQRCCYQTIEEAKAKILAGR